MMSVKSLITFTSKINGSSFDFDKENRKYILSIPNIISLYENPVQLKEVFGHSVALQSYRYIADEEWKELELV